MVGHGELAGRGRAALGTGVSLLGIGLEGTGGSAGASPGPELHQPAPRAERGEAESKGRPEQSSAPSTQGASWRAGQGREAGRERG